MAVRITDGSLSWTATIDDSELNRIADRMEARFTRLSKKIKDEGSSMEDFAKKAASAAAGYFSLQGAAGFITQMAKVRGEFQQIEVAYRTMLKSKSAADQLMAESVKLAATTPFGLKDVATGSKQLLAFGFSANEVTHSLEMLGNVAAGVGAPLNDIVYLYGTLRTQGRAYTRDIMQFTQRGIPIVDELSKILGKSKDQVQGLVEAGKVGFPEVEKAFQNLTGASGIFFNLMQEQSKTITGLLSNLADAWDKMLNDLGKQNEGLFTDSINAAISLVENYQKVIELIQLLIITYGAYRAALVLTTLATSGATAAEILHYGVLVAKDKLLGLLAGKQAALAASTAAYTAVLAALAAITYSFIQYQDAAEIAEDSLTKAKEAGTRATDNERERLEDLIDTIKDHSKTKEEQVAAYDKLQLTTGGILKKFSLEEIASGKANKALNEYLNTVRQTTAAETEYATYKGLEEKLKSLEKEGIKAVSTFDRLRQSLANTFAPGSQDLSLKEWWAGLISGTASDAKIVQQETKKIKDAQNKIIKGAFGPDVQKRIADEANKNNEKITGLVGTRYEQFNALLTKGNVLANFDKLLSLAPDKPALDKLKDAVNGAMEALAPDDKSISLYKTKIAQVDALLSRYSTSKSSKDAKKNAEDRLKFLEDLNKMELESARKSMTKNQEELKAIQDKYEQQRKEATKLNLGEGVIKRINKLEKNETGVLQYEQQTELLKTSLETQKRLYTDFENYRESFGEKKAIERYQNEIDVSKTYLDVLKENFTKSINDGVTLGQTGPVMARKLFLSKELKDTQSATDNAYQEGIKSLIAYETQRNIITQNYQRQRAAMIAKGDSVATLDVEYKEDLQKLDESNLQKLEAYKGLFAGIEGLSRDAAKKVVDDAQTMLQALKGKIASGDIKVSPEFLKSIEDALKKANDAIDDSPEKLQNMAGELGGIANMVSEIDAGFGKWLGTLSTVLGSVSKIKSDFKALGEAQKNGDTFGSISAGLGIFGAGLSIIKSITSLFSKSQEREEQAKYERDLQLKQTEAITKALDRQLAMIKEVYGEERLTKFSKGLADIQNAIADTTKRVGGLYKLTGNKATDDFLSQINSGVDPKKITGGNFFERDKFLDDLYKGKFDHLPADLEELQKLLDSGKLDASATAMVQSLINLDKQYKDTINSMKAETTGTSFESITDSLVDLFAKGTAAAEDFGKNFEEIMQKSILNSFKRNALEKELQIFYDKFADYSASGGTLTETEITELKAMYDAIIKNGQTRFDELEKLTGVKFGDTANQENQNSLQGSIKASMTEDTGTRVAGAFNGMLVAINLIREDLKTFKVTALERLDIAKANLDLLELIEAHTGKTALNSEKLLSIEKSLTSIDKKMDNPANALEANGRI